MKGLKLGPHDRIVALNKSGLSLAQKSVYLYICEICSWGKARFTKNMHVVSVELAIPYSTVRKYFRELQELGFIFKADHYFDWTGKKSKTPNRSVFAYPLMYLDELFKTKDIVLIIKNIESEVQRLEKDDEEGLDAIKNSIFKLKSALETNISSLL